MPGYALSMGIGTIMEAKEILLLANGEGKAEIIRRAPRAGDQRCAGLLLQTHLTSFACSISRRPNCLIFLDVNRCVW